MEKNKIIIGNNKCSPKDTHPSYSCTSPLPSFLSSSSSPSPPPPAISGERVRIVMRSGGGTAAVEEPLVPCSVCFEAVADGGERSTAKLQCGHRFHLDCIGSAFNAKGAMQCPNCRKVEKGNWLFANGHRLFPELSMDDWTHDEDLYGLSYQEMPYEVHWCPFTRLTHVPSSFDEDESSSIINFDDILPHHPAFAENPGTSSVSQPLYPYFAYVHQILPIPLGSRVMRENTVDSPAYHDITIPHAYPRVDRTYHGWDFYPSPAHHGSGSDQTSMSSATAGAMRLDINSHPRPGSFMHHPFNLGQRSASRGSSPPTTLGNYMRRNHTHAQEFHASSQPHGVPGLHGSNSSIWRPGNMRRSGPRGPASSPPERSAFCPFPSSTSSAPSRNPQDADFGVPFHPWARDQVPPPPVNGNLSWLDAPTQAPSGTDSSSQTGFWPQQHQRGYETSSSQSRSTLHPWMHPFI